MTQPLISIIVVNYNGINHLKACLKSIKQTDYMNSETIVVDNGSSDGSADYIERNFKNIKLIRNKSNLGAAGGYNTGIMNARGKYVAILNNDIEVPPNWLTPLVNVMEADESIAAVDPKYLNFYDRERFDTIAAAGRYLDHFGNVYARGAGGLDDGQYDRPVRIFAALTLFRRSVFKEVNMFDQDFFYGFDEVDLAWRINLRGYKIIYIPYSKIYHKVSRTSSSINNPTLRSGFYFMIKRNRLQMLIKNLSANKLIPALTITFLEYGFYLLYWLTKKNRQYTTELLSSILWICKNLKKIWIKRKAVQNIRKVSDRELNKIMVPYQGDLLKMPHKIFKTKP